MKTKSLLLALIATRFLLLASNTTNLVITSESALDLQDTSFLYEPIEFTASGCRCFFRHRLNHPKYVTDFLPYNFSHIIQFLDYGKRSGQDSFFAQSVLEIFAHKIDALTHLDPEECTHFLTALPGYLGHYFPADHQANIRTLLRTTFNQEQALLKKNPDAVFNMLSEKICDQEQLRSAINLFAQKALNKITWSHEDDVQAWQSFKNLWHSVHALKTTHLVDLSPENNDEITHLLWTLTHRFGYFLELFGSELSQKFYDQAKQDVLNNTLPLLAESEREEHIATKQKTLERALFVAEVKSAAHHQYGIISETRIISS